MPDHKKVTVYYEGDDDKAFLEKLQENHLLYDHWQIVKRDKSSHPGKDGLIGQLIPFVSPINGIDGKAVVLIDLDKQNRAALFDWFHREITQKAGEHVVVTQDRQLRVCCYNLTANGRAGHVVLVPVGDPDDIDFIAKYGIKSHALDDWTFKLILQQDIYSSISEFGAVTYDLACKKYSEVAELFRSNGLEVYKAKSYLQILRALAATQPSSATITGRIVGKAIQTKGTEAFKALIHPFYDDLIQANLILDSISNSTATTTSSTG